jgi:hypothetical protein
MRGPGSRWPAWLILAFAVLAGVYSFLGIAMVGSLYGAQPHPQYRTAAYIYLGALIVAGLVAAGAIVWLVRAPRRTRPARNASVQ